MEKFILRVIERRLKNRTIIRHSKCWFMKIKSYLINMVFFYDKVTYLMNEGETAAIIILDVSKAFDTVRHSILLD